MSQYENDVLLKMQINSICSSNDKFVYVGLSSVGVDILMLTKADSMNYEGNGFTLQVLDVFLVDSCGLLILVLSAGI